ncbi:MAG: SufE family protein [Chlamydia sp.]
MISESYQSCRCKQLAMKEAFHLCSSKELLYQAIIDLGRNQIAIDADERVPSNIVPGCQSIMYLTAKYLNGKMHFRSESDALISAGLGQLLISIYDGESPEAVLCCPPDAIYELGIPLSLTPGRANGLASLYHLMKQHALYALTQKSMHNR